MALVKRIVKGSPLSFAEGDANLDYLYSLATNTGSFFVNGGLSTLSVQNTGSSIVHALSVGTYCNEMTNFDYTQGSAILPIGYSCYSIACNSAFNNSVNLYLYAVTNGTSLVSPVYSSPIRIINTNSAYPATIRANDLDTGAPAYLQIVKGVGTTVSSFNLPSGFYVDMCLEPENSQGSLGTPAAWRIIATGSIIQ